MKHVHIDRSHSRPLRALGGLLLISVLLAPRAATADEDSVVEIQVGAGSGYAEIERQRYIELTASGMLRVGPARADFIVPLRFDAQTLAFRREDWNSPRDYARVVRCLRLDLGDHASPAGQFDPSCRPYASRDGMLHDRTYFSARLYPLANETLGHATLVNNYRASLDLDRPEVGASTQLIARDWGELDFVLGNVAQPRFLGGRAMVRPPNLFGRNWDTTPDELEVGFTWAADLSAPMHLVTAEGHPQLDAEGVTRFERRPFHTVGVDAHYLYIFGHASRRPVHGGLFVFADYNRFLGVENGEGVHAGLRAVLRKGTISIVTAGAELRYLGNGYYPGIFDADYLVRSQRFALTDQAFTLPNVTVQTTLQEMLRSRTDGHTLGYQAYLALQVPLGRGDAPTTLPVVAYVEDGEGPANATAGLIVGPVRLGPLSLSAQYLRRNFDTLKNMLDLDGSLIRARARWQLSSDPSSRLSNVALDCRFDRRFYQDTSGAILSTNDFEALVSYTHGTR